MWLVEDCVVEQFKVGVSSLRRQYAALRIFVVTAKKAGPSRRKDRL